MKLPVIIVLVSIIFFYDKTEAARGFKPLVSTNSGKRFPYQALRMKKTSIRSVPSKLFYAQSRWIVSKNIFDRNPNGL